MFCLKCQLIVNIFKVNASLMIRLVIFVKDHKRWSGDNVGKRQIIL